MNEDHFRQFVRLAQTRNFTKAAESFFITQQSLSKNINSLENELGVKLFVRTRGGTELTSTGKKLLPAVESMLEKHDEYMQMITSIIEENQSQLSVIIENTILLKTLPADFTTRIGEIKVETVVSSRDMQCEELVRSGEIDLGFAQRPENCSDLEYISVLQNRPLVYMSRDHVLMQKDMITLHDLRNFNHCWLSVKSGYFSQYYRACVEAGFFPKIVAEYPDESMLFQEIANSKSVTVGASWSYDDKVAQHIEARPLSHETLRIDIGFLVQPDYEDHPLIGSFIRAVEKYIKQSIL